MAKTKTQTSVGRLGEQYLLSVQRLNVRQSAILTEDELEILEGQIKRARAAANATGK